MAISTQSKNKIKNKKTQKISQTRFGPESDTGLQYPRIRIWILKK